MSALPLNVQRLGEGPPLLITHGLFGSGTNWRTLARSLASRWDVLLVDARNHGRSPHTDSMTYTEMATDLIRVLDDAGLAHAHVLGHSMGGKAVMTMALMNASRVSSLAVADIAPIAYTHRFGVELQAMESLDLSQVTRRSDAQAQMAELIPDANLAAFLLQNLQVDANGARWRINLPAIRANEPQLVGFEQHSQTFASTTTFIRGALSDYVQDNYTDAIRRLFPNAAIATVDGAGHWLHAERPQPFLEALQSHLNRALQA